MLNILNKIMLTILSIMTIILVIPGFVTVVGFMVACVMCWGFGYTVEELTPLTDFITSVWRFYGIF